jgi:hypothetical protein
VVDSFEVVDVGDGHRQRSLRLGGPGDLRGGLALPGAGVQQPVLGVGPGRRGQHCQGQLCGLVADLILAEARLSSRVPGCAVALIAGRTRQDWMVMLTSPHAAASAF